MGCGFESHGPTTSALVRGAFPLLYCGLSGISGIPGRVCASATPRATP